MNKRLIRKLNKPFKRYHHRNYWKRVIEERERLREKEAKEMYEKNHFPNK